MTTLFLMYHGMSDLGGGAADPHTLTRQKFTEQIEHLKNSNYRLISWGHFGNPPPSDGTQNVCITFDDGCASDLECARVLHTYGYDALFFIATEFIGRPGYLSREDIIALREMGMGIGSHAHHHAMMGSLSEAEVEAQFRNSKGILEDILHEPVVHFSFPGGSYNRRMLEIGRQAGFRYFFTSDWGNNGEKQYQTGVFRRTSLLNHQTISQFDDLVRSRHNLLHQALFETKEFTKRVVGEGSYVKVRKIPLEILHFGRSN